MSAAISALIAALAVVYSLSVTTASNSTGAATTFLRRLIDLFNGQGFPFKPEEALTGLLLSFVVYLIAFSVTYFFARFIAIFLAAFGFPDESTLRRNRELRRGKGTEMALMRRQARMNALYTVRAQQAAIIAQRRRQSARGSAPEPSVKDFNIK